MKNGGDWLEENFEEVNELFSVFSDLIQDRGARSVY